MTFAKMQRPLYSALGVTLVLAAACADPAIDDLDPSCQHEDSDCDPCGPAEPGYCPEGRVCREGACIIEFDSELADPAASLALFETIWSEYDVRYGAFPARADVDWDDVRSRYRPRVEAATTELAVAWEVAQAVAEIGDGHTAAIHRPLCEVARGFGSGWSNTGACVAEIDGRFVVYKTSLRNSLGLSPGDEVVALDGRSMEDALRDVDRQPRCSPVASTPRMYRSLLVASLLFRAPTDREVTVIRTSGNEEIIDLPSGQVDDLLVCDDRIAIDHLQQHGFGIQSAVLEPNIRYVWLPAFGGYDAQGRFVDQPVIDILRDIVEEATTSDGLILDLRSNIGGYPAVYMALAGWLYEVPTTLFTCQSKIGPGHHDHGPPWAMVSQPDPALQYGGPVAVLVNSRSFSAADFTFGFLKQTGRATTFGTPSGGGFGSGNGLLLDETWHLGFNDILCAGLDGTFLEGAPPPVDVGVGHTATDVASGRDAVVEAALRWLAAEAPARALTHAGWVRPRGWGR